MTHRQASDLPAPGLSQPDEATTDQSVPVSASELSARPADQKMSVLLGLSAVEFGIYTRMIARPSMADTEVAGAVAELGGRPEEGRAALDRLRRLDLVTAYPDDATRQVATPPTTMLATRCSPRTAGDWPAPVNRYAT